MLIFMKYLLFIIAATQNLGLQRYDPHQKQYSMTSCQKYELSQARICAMSERYQIL